MKKIKLNISYKISLLILAIISVSVGVISYISYNNFVHMASEMVSKSDAEKLFQNGNQLQQTFIILVIFIMTVTLAFSVVLSRLLTAPIISLKEYLKLMEKGILPQEIKKFTNDEVGEMAHIMNNLVQSLRRTAQFAHTIGEGNLNAKFTPIGKEDVLGNSLINMQQSLIEAERREKERNWVVNGIAEVGEILRRDILLDSMSYDVIKYMVHRISAVQGAFYRVTDSEDSLEGERLIEMVNCYAYNRKKYLNTSFKFGEGLVGQAAIERDKIFRTELPNDYCTITSGLLKDKKPTSVLIVPLITDEEIYGVIEFASLSVFTDNEIRFVEETSPIIARTIFNIHVNERTQKHLQQSQRMSAELQQQQEELRQNAEEMQATQEDLQKANHQLEDQIEEVNRTQKRMQSLLENASEVITIYEKDGRIRYISPSVTNILGLQAEELIGVRDDMHIHRDDLDEFKSLFKKLLVKPDISVTLQYRYKKNNGDWIWLEATGKNLLADPAVKGIVVNSRDITSKRKAEVEERMRKNMQALSENSPDLITRLNREGIITYTNPVIEHYTGSAPSTFMNLPLHQFATDNGMVKIWKELLDEVLVSNSKVKKETNYTSPTGDRIVKVNAIPEYNGASLESVLVVSHDVTEMKMIEREIQAKNRNIHESITYSKRIQNAIIPDNRLMEQFFGDSFIMYKPKDIVSGDFPWFMNKGDSIFISAVDCTGHGVPGAMLSLVGYFQLNNIVDANSMMNSGQILDEFDRKVNATLIRETNEENIKDGMDIAFCKINANRREIDYAGAHRPLYVLSNGEITEYKGDKWAIGGGVYKNQTNFTNHKIKLKKGESVFFFSDGYPDQFGGTQNRKLGTSKIKEIIVNNKDKPMKEMYHAFSEEFDKWKGNGKQTDDVLLIGIRF